MKKALFISSIFLQFFFACFLLAFIIFADSSPDGAELGIYLLLSLVPHVGALLLYAKQKKFLPSFLLGLGLYGIAVPILSSLDNIKGFYVTGVGGVGVESSIVVMAIHASLLLLTLFLMSRSSEQVRALKKRIPVVLICVLLTFLFIGALRTYAWKVGPNSYLALGFLHIEDVLSAFFPSIFIGFFTVFTNLKILLAVVAYALLFAGLLYAAESKFGRRPSFGQKLLIFFVPIWISMGTYIVFHRGEIKESLGNNFSNFEFVWNRASRFHPYDVKLNDVQLFVWCDEKPTITDQAVQCGERLKIMPTGAVEAVAMNVYPQELDVGMFERVPLHEDAEHSCITTRNTVTVQNAIFLVTTKECSNRNFPVMASVKWDEFVRPMLACFGSPTCYITERYP